MPSLLVLVLCKLIIIVNHTLTWHFLMAQGEVVGRRKCSSLAQGRIETLARLKLYHPSMEMVNKAKELIPRKFMVVLFNVNFGHSNLYI